MAEVHAFDVRADLVAFLRATRAQQEISQGDVADVVGVHRETVGCWEREVKEPGVSYLLAWAWSLGFDLALVPKRSERRCGVPNCRRKHAAKGLCKAHYLRLNRNGSLEVQVPIGEGPKGRRPRVREVQP